MPAQFHKIRRAVLGALGLGLVLALIVASGGNSRKRQLHPDGQEEDGGGVVKSQRLLMGTEFKVTIWARQGESEIAAAALGDLFDELAGLENRISSWLPDNETTRINKFAGCQPVRVSSELQQLLSRALYWTEKTGGAFDVSGGPLFELWEQAREHGVLPSQEAIDRRRALTGCQHLQMTDGHVQLKKAGMKLGFGAIGKGFAADRAAAFLQAKGLSNFLIDAGGDLLARGRRGDRPWKVAVRHPRRSEFLGGLEAVDCAIASSGDYERFFVVEGQPYSHILDLRTGWPAKHLTGVTVIARSATDADALATALFVMETSQGMELVEALPEVDAILVDDNGKISLTNGIQLQGDRLTVDWQ